MNWQTFFQDVPDFLINRRKRHNLIDILVISVCAFVCEADDFEDIGLYGSATHSGWTHFTTGHRRNSIIKAKIWSLRMFISLLNDILKRLTKENSCMSSSKENLGLLNGWSPSGAALDFRCLKQIWLGIPLCHLILYPSNISVLSCRVEIKYINGSKGSSLSFLTITTE